MRTVIKENNWLHFGLSRGWGNGYVTIPTGHPLHGVDYSNIDVEVHYGLTFSALITESFIEHWPELSADDVGSWMVGFDTCHYRDDIHTWPKEAVQAEADRLLDQIKLLS